MTKADFDEFVKRQQAAPSDGELVDWDAERDEWLGHLDSFYAKVEGFLADYIKSGQIQTKYSEIELIEDDMGAYKAKALTLRIGRREVVFTPIGTMLIGSKGRIEVEGRAGKVTLVLADKKARNIREQLFERRSPPIEWEWKIFSRSRDFDFVPLNADTFLDIILEVANA